MRTGQAFRSRTAFCRLVFSLSCATAVWAACEHSAHCAEPLAADRKAISIQLHGWDGDSLPFVHGDDLLTVWHCRVYCGELRSVALDATLFAEGKEQILAKVDAPVESGTLGTLYAVRSEPNADDSRQAPCLAAIGLSFQHVVRKADALAVEKPVARKLLSLITPRQDFLCEVGKKKMLFCMMLSDPGNGEEEEERVSDAAATGDYAELLRVARSCARVEIVIVAVTCE